MNTQITTLPENEARKQGYYPLAGPYEEHEDKWMESVIADMRRGKTDFVIVTEKWKRIYGPSVWRR